MSAENRDLELIQKSLDTLGEHFDTVQIFASRHEQGEEGGTIAASEGVGNWFARFGQVREWLSKQDERVKVIVRKEEHDDG